MSRIDFPTVSAGVYPKSASAPAFQDVMMPSSVLLTIASSDDSMIAPKRASTIELAFRCSISRRKRELTSSRSAEDLRCRRFSSVRTRSVMSMPVGTTTVMRPPASLIGIQAKSTMCSEPSAQK
jgi:hypothetical protein